MSLTCHLPACEGRMQRCVLSPRKGILCDGGRGTRASGKHMNTDEGAMAAPNPDFQEAPLCRCPQIWWKLLLREIRASPWIMHFRKKTNMRWQDEAGMVTTSSWAEAFPLPFQGEIIFVFKGYKSNSWPLRKC